MKRDRQSVNDRHTKILTILRENTEVKVEELALRFGVSLMTIRRDLQYLEERGYINRFYGGATMGQQAPNVSNDDDVALYRELIARYAASLVFESDYLFINGSQTALSVLDYIDKKDVHVFTNNGSAVAKKLTKGLRLTLSGGEMRGQSAILTGDCAMRNLLMEQAEKAFIGCTGISPTGEVLCGIPTELAINETMIGHSFEYYILADHTKIGVVGNYASWHLEKMGTVITDEKAPANVVEQLRFIGMTVIQVKKSDFDAVTQLKN